MVLALGQIQVQLEAGALLRIDPKRCRFSFKVAVATCNLP
jgi:hypothetical protein